MFATLASLLLGLSPVPQTAALALHDDRSVLDAVAVQGTTELSRAEALAAARTAVAGHVRDVWRERADRILVDGRPFWMPELLADRAVSRWLGAQTLERTVEVVDREDKVREHEFGRSYQTTLWIREDPRLVEHGTRQLRRELERTQRRTLVLSGATVGFWAALGVLLAWIDRLSRGYMTGRLRCIGLLVGAAVPSLAFLL